MPPRTVRHGTRLRWRRRRRRLVRGSRGGRIGLRGMLIRGADAEPLSVVVIVREAGKEGFLACVAWGEPGV